MRARGVALCASMLFACGTPSARAGSPACEEAEVATPPELPRCPGVELRPVRGQVRLVVDGRVVEAIDAPEALAWRGPSGVGWVALDENRRARFRAPGRAAVRLDLIPEDAQQWGLVGVSESPEGWRVRAWASWVHEHYESAPARTLVLLIPRGGGEPEPTCDRSPSPPRSDACVSRSDPVGRCLGRC